jgi:hypothetical protein
VSFRGNNKNACRILENVKEGEHLEDLGVDGRVSILEKLDGGRMWAGLGAYGGLL